MAHQFTANTPLTDNERKTAELMRDGIAKLCDVYAGDLQMLINRGYTRGAQLAKSRHQIEVYRNLASEIREIEITEETRD